MNKYREWVLRVSKETNGQHVCVNCGAVVTVDDVDDWVKQVLIGEGYDAEGNYYCSAECKAERKG